MRPFLEGIIEQHRESVSAAVAAAMIPIELEAGSRYATLLPVGVQRGEPCEPGKVYELAAPGRSSGFNFCIDQRLLRLMTHPADARAGWHLVPPFGLSVMPLSIIDQETRFDAFHWVLSRAKTGLEDLVFLDQVQFLARAVLRATEPRPMLHGLWIKFYDGRCRSPGVEYYERIARGIGKRFRGGRRIF